MNYFDYLWNLYDKRKIDYYCGRIDTLPPFPMWCDKKEARIENEVYMDCDVSIN